MSHHNSTEFFFHLAAGRIKGFGHIEKFGRATNVDDGVLTDIWDRANPTDDQPIWVAPTQARTHQIVSTDAGDTLVGGGARTVEIRGLPSWGQIEVTETIELNGTSNVATVNQYVIIHRMEVKTNGATNINIGNIKATADTDSSVTAQINAGKGQTQMVVYGVPSTKISYIRYPYANLILDKGKDSDVEVDILINTTPDVEILHYTTKFVIGLRGEGDSGWQQAQERYIRQPGPCIIKLQALSDTNNAIVFGGFDVILEDI